MIWSFLIDFYYFEPDALFCPTQPVLCWVYVFCIWHPKFVVLHICYGGFRIPGAVTGLSRTASASGVNTHIDLNGNLSPINRNAPFAPLTSHPLWLRYESSSFPLLSNWNKTQTLPMTPILSCHSWFPLVLLLLPLFLSPAFTTITCSYFHPQSWCMWIWEATCNVVTMCPWRCLEVVWQVRSRPLVFKRIYTCTFMCYPIAIQSPETAF